ncbi:metal-dependent hydrolase [Lysobacter humi (ex Lee et al. 2017)]
MDSVTQFVLGAAVAAAIAPPRHRRAALLAGAALGTLPDLDVLVINALTEHPVHRMTWHRGFSHSLLVLPVIGLLLWAAFRRWGWRVREAPTRWFWAIQLALVTHPLLDAFTVYGTQLLWPLRRPPTMGASVFIIDPLYTVWLLAACTIAAWLGERRGAQRALVAALAISSAYLGWSLLAKSMVERAAERSLATMGLADAPRFSVPMPFNTLLWRVVAMTPDGFVEGERSIVADDGPMRFRRYRSDVAALAAVRGWPIVRELAWFNHGFMKAEVREGRLVLSDLRMGSEPDYTFRFVVARRDGDRWVPVPVEQPEWPWEARKRLSQMWTRIWNPAPGEPAAAGGRTP